MGHSLGLNNARCLLLVMQGYAYIGSKSSWNQLVHCRIYIPVKHPRYRNCLSGTKKLRQRQIDGPITKIGDKAVMEVILHRVLEELLGLAHVSGHAWSWKV